MRSRPCIMLLLLPVVICACTAYDMQQERDLPALHLTLAAAKSPSPEMENGISRICYSVFDENGIITDDSGIVSAKSHTFLLPPGRYSVRICTGDIPPLRYSMADYDDYRQSMEYNGYSGGFPMSWSSSVALESGRNLDISPSLKRNCSKICLAGIRLDTAYFGNNTNNLNFRLIRAFIMDAAEHVRINGDASDDGQTFNRIVDGNLSLCNGSKAACTIAECASSVGETYTDPDVTLFSNPSVNSKLILETEAAFLSGEKCRRFYQIPLTLSSNHCYNCFLTITGAGTEKPGEGPADTGDIVYDIVEWEEGKTEEIWF